MNAHPGETVTLDPFLYDALTQAVEAGDRHIFLGPVYEEYDRVFLAESDAEAARYDPTLDETQRAYAARQRPMPPTRRRFPWSFWEITRRG